MPKASAREVSSLLDDPDRLLTYDEVGILAGGIPGRSVRKWVADGTGPRVVALGRYRRIRVRDYLAWLDGRYVQQRNGAA